MKFVIVIFDGLRAQDVTAALMPNLFALRDEGTWLARHVATFPSETRVSAAALSSGTYGSRHGIVGNQFLDTSRPAAAVVDGGQLDALLHMGDRRQSRALGVEGLGEWIAEFDHQMLSVGAQSSGSWGLGHWNGWARGEFGYWCPDPRRFSNHADVLTLAASRPPLPAMEKPALRATTRVVDVFLDAARTNQVSSVSLLWFPEPDVSQHAFGLAAPETRDVLRHADREFGRIVDWWMERRDAEDIQLIVGSDHGHLTVGGKVSVGDALREAGFTVGQDFTAPTDVALVSQRVASLWFRNSDNGLARAAFSFIAEQPWCGPSFSRPGADGTATIAGTFPHDAVFADHPRSPDLAVVLADLNDGATDGGAAMAYCDGPFASGTGMHGGLNRRELTAVGLCVGSFFRRGHCSNLPSGIVDIAPTILFGLDVPAPASMDGRVLFEALSCPPPAWRPPHPEPCDISVERAGQRSTIERLRYGDCIYVSGARHGPNGRI